MKFLGIFVALIVIPIAAYILSRPADEASPMHQVQGLPWQIDVLADGNSRVFGLELMHSTLNDARLRFGDMMKLGVIAAQDEAGALEAYYESITAGVIVGRMILTADADAQTLAGMRARSVKREHLNEMTFRYVLDTEDTARALHLQITAITFIPVANLDEATVLKRFGTPDERLRVSEQAEHFLYPQRGLDLLLDTTGKAVLQYVAPRRFDRLREPLSKIGTGNSLQIANDLN